MNPLEYDYVLSGDAVRALLGAPKRLRRLAESIIDRIAANPFSEPDFVERSPSEREFAVLVQDEVIVTYWVDHGAKEIRVIRVEFA